MFVQMQRTQTQQYTLTLSHEFPSGVVLDVSYLGTHGTHFITPIYDINQLDPKYFSLGTAYLNESVANPYAGVVPGSLGASTLPRKILLKPYPYMAVVGSSYFRDSHYNGNYLYVSVVRRAHNGLQLQGAYTYGKLLNTPIYTDLGTAPGVTPSAGTLQNWRDPRSDYSVDAIEVQHRITATLMYDLPFGRNRSFFANSRWINRTIGGIQFNTNMIIQGGLPLAITGANNQGIASRPNVLPGVSVKVAHPTAAKWFNTAAFVNPPDYSFGNSPRFFSGLRSPKTVSFDMSLFKRIPLADKVNLEMRVEAFNALNHLNLSAPNTSFTAASATEGSGNSNSSFGTITSSGGGRTVQLGAKLKF